MREQAFPTLEVDLLNEPMLSEEDEQLSRCLLDLLVWVLVEVSAHLDGGSLTLELLEEIFWVVGRHELEEDEGRPEDLSLLVPDTEDNCVNDPEIDLDIGVLVLH